MTKAPYDFFDYPSYWKGREYEDRVEKIALKKLLAKIPDKSSIVDIGGGFGRLAEVYTPVFKRCLLIDPSEKLLDEAKKRLKKFKNIEFKKGRAEDIPASQGDFRVALMVRVVHHLSEPEKAFREAQRVLKPQGYLIVEFANKIHFSARLRAWLRGDFGFSGNLEPVDQRSAKSIKAGIIPFLNHHPQAVKNSLEKFGFRIVTQLSVSNFRHPVLKKIIPLRMLLFLESNLQPLASKLYFGPSIFVLAKKT